ncbi:MAG: sigma-70 family RNA polymerase sigma factor [Pseudomonadota bacterium]
MSGIQKAYLENQEALRRFLRQFYKRAEDVEDAAQEAFLRAFRAEIDGEIREPKAFLFRVARNYALGDLAKKSNTTTEYLIDSDISSVLVDEKQIRADDQLESKQKLILLVEAVAALPPQCRRVFVMRKFQGMRVKDIAAAMGTGVGTVDKHLATGLARCSEYLHANGFDDGARASGDGRAKPSETGASKESRTTSSVVKTAVSDVEHD